MHGIPAGFLGALSGSSGAKGGRGRTAQERRVPYPAAGGGLGDHASPSQASASLRRLACLSSMTDPGIEREALPGLPFADLDAMEAYRAVYGPS
jgi:hypothetical protein